MRNLIYFTYPDGTLRL